MRTRWSQVQELAKKQKEEAGSSEVVVCQKSTHAWENASKSLTRPSFPELVQQALRSRQQTREPD
jgi:hypothetical protein